MNTKKSVFHLEAFPQSLTIPLPGEVLSVDAIVYTDAGGHRGIVNANVFRHRVEEGKHVVRQSCGGPWPAGAKEIKIICTVADVAPTPPPAIPVLADDDSDE